METYTVKNINRSQLGWHTNMPGDLEWLYLCGWMDNGYKYGITIAYRIDSWEFLFGEKGNCPFIYYWATNPDGETQANMITFPVEQYKFKEEDPWGVSIGDNFCKGSLTPDGEPAGYHLKVALDDFGIDITAKAICTGIRFVEEEHGYLLYNKDKDTAVGWWPLVPRASIKGTITFKGKKIQVTGLGYCERQMGNSRGLFMAEWLSRSFWGLCWAGDYTAIWCYCALDEGRQYRPFSPLVLYKGSDIILSTNNLSLSPDIFEFDKDNETYYVAQETIHATDGNIELLLQMSTRTFNEKLTMPMFMFRGYADADVEIRRLDRWEKMRGQAYHELCQMIPWIPVLKK